jgi:DNA-3-methyladenine glycosylase
MALAVGEGDARVVVVITETEAYEGVEDPASHAWKGQNRRNAVMFGPPGGLYCYTMHGHTCCNVVCSEEGSAEAVLVRAGRVVEGAEIARARRMEARAARRGQGPGIRPIPDAHLARGPGCLTRALGITMDMAGTDVFDPDAPVLLLQPSRSLRCSDRLIAVGPRIGVPRAQEEPLRFFIAGDPTVSGPLRHSPSSAAYS